MEKYLVTFEFRYNGVTNRLGDMQTTCVSKTLTVGLYQTFEEACSAGNEQLELLEWLYPLHEFPDDSKAEQKRFSTTGGPFGSKNDLISDSAYLRTPFSFFGKITTCSYGSVVQYASEAEASLSRYKSFQDLIED